MKRTPKIVDTKLKDDPGGKVSLAREALDDFAAGMRKDDDSVLDLATGAGTLRLPGVVSTQCPQLDDAIGRGGIPLGRLTIFHGPEGCGKTTHALHLCAEAQQSGGIAMYIDREYKLDVDYAAAIGVDMNSMVVSQPDTMEQIFALQASAALRVRALRKRLKIKIPLIVVQDSINSAITQAQHDGGWDDKHWAPQARVISDLTPKLIPSIARDSVGLVWISQIRKKMNVKFGDDEEVGGGNAPRFYASLVCHFKKIGTAKVGAEQVGSRIHAYIKKNQIAVPHKHTEYTIVWGRGVDQHLSLVEMALAKKVLTKGTEGISYGGERLCKGIAKCANIMRDNPKLAAEIAAKTKVKWR
jgi:recombination protein RecA